MADRRYVIVVDDRDDQWRLLLDIASVLTTEHWTLVGGLMVQAHAARAGIEPTRATSDVDVLISLRCRVSDVAAPLLRAGFVAQVPNGTGPFHRFRRERDIVDIMVAASAGSARWARRGVLRTPGATQTQQRQDVYFIGNGTASVGVRVPDSVGAVIVKAAAYRVDSRDCGRHLEDIVVLLAAADRAAFEDAVLTARDRHHLRPALIKLRDEFASPWRQLGARESAVARARFDQLADLAGVG
jgi:hypothetical protein